MFFKLYEKYKSGFGGFAEQKLINIDTYDIGNILESQNKYLMTTNHRNIDNVSRIIETLSSSAIERIGLEIPFEDSLKILEAGQKTDNDELNANDELNKFIRENYNNIDLTYDNIINLHNILFRDTKYSYQAGKIATMSNKIEIRTYSGKVVSDINNADGSTKEQLLRELLEWASKNIHDLSSPHHPQITRYIFILDFLMIHPFVDGNGRLSRALHNLLLLKTKSMDHREYWSIASLSDVINCNKVAYYRCLNSIGDFVEEQTDFSLCSPWISFMKSVEMKMFEIGKKHFKKKINVKNFGEI